jgi:flagellar hook-associated protein 3 FlgL
VQISQNQAALSQFATNQQAATSSLGLEDSTLGSVTSVLQDINSLLVQAGTGTLNDSNRQALAKELQGDRDTLMSLANTTDGAGNFIFSGFQAGSPPFSNQSGGGVTYTGDTGTRMIQVTGTSSIASGDNGASVFLSVLGGLAQPVPAGAATNTGTGTIVNPVTISTTGAPTNNNPYSITFSSDPATGALQYEVDDTSTTPPTQISVNQPFTADQPINLGPGMSVQISGTPAPGDSFTVTPAAKGNTDVFSTLDTVIAALQVPAQNNPTATATVTTALTTASTELANTMTNVSTLQASVGGREQQLKALSTVNQTQALQGSSDLSDIVQANPAEVLSQFTLVQTALNAAEVTFAKVVQGSDLFSVISP